MCVCFVTQSLSDSLQPHGLRPARLLCSQGFSRQVYWSGLPCPHPGDLPNPGIEPRSPALQADSIPTEPPGKPKDHHIPFQKPHKFFFFNISEATRFMCIERRVLLCAAMRMDLEGILLREESQRGKDKHCVTSHKCGI